MATMVCGSPLTIRPVGLTNHHGSHWNHKPHSPASMPSQEVLNTRWGCIWNVPQRRRERYNLADIPHVSQWALNCMFSPTQAKAQPRTATLGSLALRKLVARVCYHIAGFLILTKIDLELSSPQPARVLQKKKWTEDAESCVPFDSWPLAIAYYLHMIKFLTSLTCDNTSCCISIPFYACSYPHCATLAHRSTLNAWHLFC